MLQGGGLLVPLAGNRTATLGPGRHALGARGDGVFVFLGPPTGLVTRGVRGQLLLRDGAAVVVRRVDASHVQYATERPQVSVVGRVERVL